MGAGKRRVNRRPAANRAVSERSRFVTQLKRKGFSQKQIKTELKRTTTGARETRRAKTFAELNTNLNQELSRLESKDPEARMNAVKTFEYLGIKGREVEKGLTKALKDPDELVRGEAARTLGRLGMKSPKVEMALTRMASKDPDKWVRGMAEGALRILRVWYGKV